MNEADEFRDPNEVISYLTLDAFGTTTIACDLAHTWAVAGAEEQAWFNRLDPALALALQRDEDGWTHAPDICTTPERTAERSVVRCAERVAYRTVRILLGTDEQPLRWSADAEDDADGIAEAVEGIDIAEVALLGPNGFAGFGIEVVDGLAAEAGWADDEHLVSVGLMAYDTGLTLALLENDRVLDRSGHRLQPRVTVRPPSGAARDSDRR